MTSTLIIIPTNLRGELNALIAMHPAFPAGTSQEFKVPLYDAGDELQETETHYWLAHRFTSEQRAIIDVLNESYPTCLVIDYDMDVNPQFPESKLQEMGLVRTKSSIT